MCHTPPDPRQRSADPRFLCRPSWSGLSNEGGNVKGLGFRDISPMMNQLEKKTENLTESGGVHVGVV